MFDALTTDQLEQLLRSLVRSNARIVMVYGSDHPLNTDLCDLFDEVEQAANARGLVFL